MKNIRCFVQSKIIKENSNLINTVSEQPFLQNVTTTFPPPQAQPKIYQAFRQTTSPTMTQALLCHTTSVRPQTKRYQEFAISIMVLKMTSLSSTKSTTQFHALTFQPNFQTSQQTTPFYPFPPNHKITALSSSQW